MDMCNVSQVVSFKESVEGHIKVKQGDITHRKYRHTYKDWNRRHKTGWIISIENAGYF